MGEGEEGNQGWVQGVCSGRGAKHKVSSEGGRQPSESKPKTLIFSYWASPKHEDIVGGRGGGVKNLRISFLLWLLM